MAERAPRLIGVSLKAYMGLARTLDWVGAVALLAGGGGANGVAMFVAPGFVSLREAGRRLEGSGIALAAQDVSAEGAGAFTGEVPASVLAEAGCRYAVVGHAERRRLFGESDAVVGRKVAAAVGAGLVPVVCVGETERADADASVAACLRQIEAALRDVPDAVEIVVAWEPVWAIGAASPAPPATIRAVAGGLRARLEARGSARLIYGGSAGPGLLAEIGDSVDGLFLGRFVHDPARLADVIREAQVR